MPDLHRTKRRPPGWERHMCRVRPGGRRPRLDVTSGAATYRRHPHRRWCVVSDATPPQPTSAPTGTPPQRPGPSRWGLPGTPGRNTPVRGILRRYGRSGLPRSASSRCGNTRAGAWPPIRGSCHTNLYRPLWKIRSRPCRRPWAVARFGREEVNIPAKATFTRISADSSLRAKHPPIVLQPPPEPS